MREDDDYATTIRSMIQHEDTLRDQRLGWLFALNGFLFAALAFAWKEASSYLVFVISALGIAVAFCSAVTLAVTGVAINRLAKSCEGKEVTCPIMGVRTEDLRKKKDHKEREAKENGVPLAARLAGKHKFLYSWTAVPWLLVLAWLAVLVIGIWPGLRT